MNSGEEVEVGVTGAGIVAKEGVCGAGAPCLLEQPVRGVCLGAECANNKSHFQADAEWVRDNTAEVVEFTGENVALA